MKLLKDIWRFFFPVAKEIVTETVRNTVRRFSKKVWRNRSFRKQQLIGKRIGNWRVTKFVSYKQTKKSKKPRNSFTYKLESWQRVSA